MNNDDIKIFQEVGRKLLSTPIMEEYLLFLQSIAFPFSITAKHLSAQ